MSEKPETSKPEASKPAAEAAASNGTDASEPAADAGGAEMTKEEKKFLMLALWDALIAPKWTKDDLIDFGKAIFSKKHFKDMSDAEFNKVFPFLTAITVDLGKKLTQKAEEVASKLPAPSTTPGQGAEK